MSTQIFKNNIPNENFFALLDSISSKFDDKLYILNNESYKKGIYNEEIPKFIEQCIPYYHISKRKYL